MAKLEFLVRLDYPTGYNEEPPVAKWLSYKGLIKAILMEM